MQEQVLYCICRFLRKYFQCSCCLSSLLDTGSFSWSKSSCLPSDLSLLCSHLSVVFDFLPSSLLSFSFPTTLIIPSIFLSSTYLKKDAGRGDGGIHRIKHWERTTAGLHREVRVITEGWVEAPQRQWCMMGSDVQLFFSLPPPPVQWGGFHLMPESCVSGERGRQESPWINFQ